MSLQSLRIDEGFFRKICYDIVLDRVDKASSFAGLKVLDVGCGKRATLTRLLESEKGCKVTYLDSDPENIRNLPAESKVCGDATRLPFDDNVFDHIVSLDMMEHVAPPDRAKVIREMARVMKKGGHLFLTASRFSSRRKAVTIFFTPWFKLLGADYPKWFVEHDRHESPVLRVLANICEESGLKVVFRKPYQGIVNVFFMGIFYTAGFHGIISNNAVYVLLKFFDLPPRCSFFMEAVRE